MSSFNQFMNAFGQGREVPDAINGQMPSMALPTSVPVVKPVNTIPDNIGDVAKYNSYAQLSRALGVTSSTAQSAIPVIQQAIQNRQALAHNKAYSEGLVEASNLASENRDVYSALTKGGLVPSSQNPYHVMGYQAGALQSLSAQYKNDLVQARMANPYTDPLELQGKVKQKYQGVLGQFRPELAVKFFLEPGAAADKDDDGLFQSKNQQRFGQTIKTQAASGISNTISSQAKILWAGNSTMADFQGNVKSAFEAQLKTLNATGVPYQEAADSAFEQAVNDIKTMTRDDGKEISLTERLSMLKSLNEAQLPDGNKVLLGPLGEKYAKAVHEIRSQELSDEKTRREIQKLATEEATGAVVNKMAADVKAGKLGRAEDYISPKTQANPVNPKEIADTYKALTANNVQSIGEMYRGDLAVNATTDAVDPGVSTHAFARKYAPEVRRGNLSPDSFNSHINYIQSREEKAKKAETPKQIDMKPINEAMKTIPVFTRGSVGRWAYPNRTGAEGARQLNSDLQDLYHNKFTDAMVAWKDKHPQASPTEEYNYSQQVWRNQLKPQLERDVTKIESMQGSWRDIVSGTGGSAPRASSSLLKADPVKKQQPSSPAAWKSKNSYLTDPGDFQKASTQYYQRTGPLYELFKKAIAKTNNPASIEYQMRKWTPKDILQELTDKGFPTLLLDEFAAKRKASGGNNARK